MATVDVTPTARRNLEARIETLSLPPSTVATLRASLEPLRRVPRLGAPLEGRWAGYDEAADGVDIVTIRDARSARSPRLRPG